MKLFFLQSSTENTNPEKKMKGSNKSTKKKKKAPFISLLSYPSSSSSSSSESAATTPTTTLPAARRPPLIGRNASCLDAEYVVDYVSTSSSSLRPGKSTREELEIVLARLGGGREEAVAEILAEVDRDGDISVDEILALRAAAAAEEEEELRVAFAVYDADGDGKISAEELREVFRMIGDDVCTIADCRRMIRGVDSDGDGFVCFRDFVRMMSTGL